MSVISTLIVKIRSQLDGEGFDAAEKRGGSFASSMKGKIAGAFSVAAIAAFGKAAVEAFNTQEQAVAKVRATLESMGPIAGKSLDELLADASALQETSLFGDEEILGKVTAQLLTFGNIAGDSFDRAQQAAVDLAAQLGGDLQSATIMVGKALNDPIAGFSALSRVGIQFTEEQKATAQAMVEAGDAAGAQAVILGELERQFGGTAAAVAAAGTGPFTQFSNNLGDLTETVGGLIVSALNPFVAVLNDVVVWVKNLSAPLSKLVTGTAATGAAVGALALAFGPVGVAIAGVVAAVVLLMKNWDKIVDWLKKTFPQAWKAGERALADLKKGFDTVVKFVAKVWTKFGKDIVGALKFAGRVITDFVDDVVGVFDVFIRNIADVIDFVRAVFTGDWGAALDAAKAIATRTFDFIVQFVLRSVDRLLAGVQAVVAFFDDDWAASIENLRTKYTTLDTDVTTATGNVVTATGGVVKAAGDAAKTIPPDLTKVGDSFKEDLSDKAVEAKDETITALSLIAKAIGGSEGEIASNLKDNAIAKSFADIKEAAETAVGKPGDSSSSASVVGKLRLLDEEAVATAEALAGAGTDSMSSAMGTFNVAAATAGQTFSDFFGSTTLGGIVNSFSGAFGQGGSLTSLFLPGGIFAMALGGLLDMFGAKLQNLINSAIAEIGKAIASIPEILTPGTAHTRGVREVLDAVRDIMGAILEDEPDISPQELIDRLVRFALGEAERQGVHIPPADLESLIRQMLIDLGIITPGGEAGGGMEEIRQLLNTAGLPQSLQDQIVNFLSDALSSGMELPDVSSGLAGFGLSSNLISQILSIFGNIPRFFGGAAMAGQLHKTHGLFPAGSHEFFVPAVSGSIITARQLSTAMRGGMAGPVNITALMEIEGERLPVIVTRIVREALP